MRTGRAISSMFAFVLITGVALAIAVGFIGYIMSIWAHQGETRMILIYPDTTIDTEKNVLYLHVLNKGSRKVTIYKVEIKDKEIINIKIDLIPGREITTVIPLTEKYNQGQFYIIEIYTEEGDILKQPIYIPVKAV